MAGIKQADDSLIPPDSLKRFLAASQWSIIEDRSGAWEIWRSPDGLDAPPTLTLLFDHEYADYGARLYEANQILLNAYRFSAIDLAEKITALSADLFFFRIEQESRDGTIPFKQAQRALESIATMVKAAATTVASPSHSHKGRRPAQVEEFLTDDLRLGHTKKGSFVVTAAARFDPDELSSPLSEKEGVPQGAPQLSNPFARRVMTTFSRSLAAAKAVGAHEVPVGTAIEQGLSLELVEALERISSEDGLQTIEVSFDWSETVPAPPEDVPMLVTFDRAAMDLLPSVAESLQIRSVPRDVEVVGPVIALSRSLEGEETAASGEVTVLGEIDGSIRKITLALEGEEHDFAIRAYREHFPVIVTGQLAKRRIWRLEGAVSLDVEAARQLAVRRTGPSQGESVVPAVVNPALASSGADETDEEADDPQRIE